MYGSSLYDRPRTDSTVGHAKRALDDLHIHGKLVKGGPAPRSKQQDDMQKLRSKWPRHALARIRRENLQQSITEKAQISMLNSQLSQVRGQMPAWGSGAPPAQHVAHRDYILAALRKLGAQNVAADSNVYTSAPAAAAFADPDADTIADPVADPAADPATTETDSASSSVPETAAAADPVTPAPKPKPKPRAARSKPMPKPSSGQTYVKP